MKIEKSQQSASKFMLFKRIAKGNVSIYRSTRERLIQEINGDGGSI